MTWPPATEADLLSALAAGDIAESNNLDVKTLIGDSDRSRRDTAKDLASFAVDGGALLIGVREHKDTRTFECSPVDLHDSLERIEQIAANRIDPPLVVHPREITSAISGLGYIWVDIPASPDAPHMVDGRYYGRGERTNRSLPDAEVLRLHRLNAGFQISTAGALDALQLKDPYLQPGRTGAEGHLSPPAFGHLYLVATPRRASPRLAQDLIWDRYEELFPLIGQAEKSVPSALRNYGPHLQGFSPEVRSSSVVLTNLLQDPLESEGTEKFGMEIHIGIDASVSMIITRVSTPGNERGPARLLDGVVLANSWRFLAWVRALSDMTGYLGTWDVGLRGSMLRGRTSLTFAGYTNGASSRAYDEDSYEQSTTAAPRDLAQPALSVRQLSEPLLRGLNSWGYWLALLPELGGTRSPHL